MIIFSNICTPQRESDFLCVAYTLHTGLCAYMWMVNTSFNADDDAKSCMSWITVKGLSKIETNMPFLEMVLAVDKVDAFLDGRICRKGGEVAPFFFSANEYL